MPFIRTAFHRVLDPLDRRVVNRVVSEHKGNHGVGEGDGAWTCQRHLKALLFAQLAGLSSLREIEQALAARPEALYHLGLRVAGKSTLSDANAARPAAVFRDLAGHLMSDVTRRLRQEGKGLIELIDASPIPLRDARFAWPEADSRVRGLKLYVHYDPETEHPTCFDLTSPKVRDTTLARAITITPGATYVFDKGVADYSWWFRVWTHKMNVNGGSNGTEQQGRTRKAGFCPVERSDEAGQRHLTVLKGYDRFTWLQRCKTLKTGRFPSVFRLVSNQIGSYHLHAFYRSTP